MNNREFALEQLEHRAYFSAAAPMDAGVDVDPVVDPMVTATLYAAPRTSTAAATTHSPFSGAFNVAGTFTKPIAVGNPDAGSNFIFKGAGKTKSLGSFTLTGNVRAPGFVAHAKASGQLVLTTPKGTLTLSVSGSASSGSLPTTANFTITKGTGAYAKSTGKGTVGVSASNTTHKFVFSFHPAA